MLTRKKKPWICAICYLKHNLYRVSALPSGKAVAIKVVSVRQQFSWALVEIKHLFTLYKSCWYEGLKHCSFFLAVFIINMQIILVNVGNDLFKWHPCPYLKIHVCHRDSLRENILVNKCEKALTFLDVTFILYENHFCQMCLSVIIHNIQWSLSQSRVRSEFSFSHKIVMMLLSEKWSCQLQKWVH